jgi:hypothetical protein
MATKDESEYFIDVEVMGSQVWATTSESIARIDSTNGRIAARIDPGECLPSAIGSDGSSLWIVCPESSLAPRSQLLRIDPETGAIAQKASYDAVLSAISLGGGFIWLSGNEEGPAYHVGAVYKVDPTSLDVVASVSVPDS